MVSTLFPRKGPPIPRTGLDAVEKRKISCPCLESNPVHQLSCPSLIAIIIELSELPVTLYYYYYYYYYYYSMAFQPMTGLGLLL
jgi:hypothetical protein